MKVEVAYALPDVQVILETEVPDGATVEDAIRASGILERFPEIDLEQQKVGIFSKVARLSASLQEWDRVEIYRPLIADPKAARRERAQRDGRQGRTGRKGSQEGRSRGQGRKNVTPTDRSDGKDDFRSARGRKQASAE